jgi:tetratricopeptide (TPR) repeat protein
LVFAFTNRLYGRESARDLDHPSFRFRYAALLARLRAYDLAFEGLGAVLTRHPTYQPSLKLGGELRVRYKLGVLAFAGDEYLTGFRVTETATDTTTAAEQVVRSAGELGQRRDWAEMYVELGLGQYRAGDRASAVSSFRRALDFQPENRAARHNLKAVGAALARYHSFRHDNPGAGRVVALHPIEATAQDGGDKSNGSS